VLSGTPVNGDVGAINVVVTATDISGTSVSDGYTLTVEDTRDAIIHTIDNMLLNNLSIHYMKDGVDTGVFTLLEDGGIKIDTSVEFDSVILSDDTAYSDNLNILDLYGVLNNIGQAIDTNAEHASDMDNDGVINILDLYATLNGIGQAPQTFDLVDQDGNLVTNLNTDLADIANWTIVANGDVNMSGVMWCKWILFDSPPLTYIFN